MKKNKKIAIYIPASKKNSKKKEGFLKLEAVHKIETILKKNLDIDFLGNVDFKEINASENKFIFKKVDLKKVDLFFWYAPGMKKYLPALKQLAKLTKVQKSPKSFETVSDKYLSHTILKKNGLPVAEFDRVRFDDIAKMKKLIKKWKIILIKPEKGSFGRGIIRVIDFETFRDICGYLKITHKQDEVFVERFYENDISQWISTTIIGTEVAYGYRKKKEKFAEWKVYDINAMGGGAFYVDPAPVQKFAKKAAHILDKSIVGFDFIKTREGYRIVDENNFPGFYPKAFRDARKDPAKLITDLIVSLA
jgi:glutathione synthase/RimK-type ligase-like ATP-grasp enzyme